MTHYAGIGSRGTPADIQALMTQLARKLEGQGYILRSGGATGADQAFQAGVQNPLDMEIYLPSESFNGFQSEDAGFLDATKLLAWEQALALVTQYHPSPGKLSSSAFALLARNAFQVLGKDLKTPSKFIICWTRQGHLTGGTSHAIRLANAWGIPVRNLGKAEVLEEAKEFLETEQSC